MLPRLHTHNSPFRSISFSHFLFSFLSSASTTFTHSQEPSALGVDMNNMVWLKIREKIMRTTTTRNIDTLGMLRQHTTRKKTTRSHLPSFSFFSCFIFVCHSHIFTTSLFILFSFFLSLHLFSRLFSRQLFATVCVVCSLSVLATFLRLIPPIVLTFLHCSRVF